MDEFLRRLRYYLRRRQFDAELEEEMAFHRAQSGARRFGNVTRLKEDSHAAWRWAPVDGAARDLRYGLRQLRRSPTFAAVAILSLGLGVGANTAIFEVLNALRLRTLPVQRPETLVEIEIAGGNRGFGVNRGWNSLTYALWERIRDQQDAFAGTFAWAPGFDLAVGEGVARQQVRGAWVSGEAFEVLGVVAERGRLLTPDDDRQGCAAHAVIGYGFWQREFGGRDSAIGSQLVVSDTPVTVVGVTPRSFFGIEVGRNFDVALPFCAIALWDPAPLQRRDQFWLGAFGRLLPGGTVERAGRYLETASPAWFDAVSPDGYDATSMGVWNGFRLTATPAANGISALRADYETSLWLLLGITGLVLLVASANLANLTLARFVARGRELALRTAIGASRPRIVQQLFWESLVIAVGGTAVGLALASIFSEGLLRFLSTPQSLIELDLRLDWPVVAFSSAVGLAACFCFGLSTAVHATRGQTLAAVTSSGRGMTADRRRFSFQRVLITAQVAMSLVLVASSLLFVRSFWNLLTFDAGFRQQGVAFHYLDFSTLESARDGVEPLQQEVLDRLRAVPGVESVATTTHRPLSGQGWGLMVRGSGSSREEHSRFTWVSPHYFETMEIPIRAGRDLTEFDGADAPRVLLVNETFARRFLPDVSPVGASVRSLAEPGYPETLYEIVGVVEDTKYLTLREEPAPIAYAPESQQPVRRRSAIVTRSSLPLPAVRESVSAVVGAMHPGIRVDDSIDLRAQSLSRLSRDRMLAWLAGFFGVVGVVVASIGLYGVVNYIVAGRRNEFGIRLALGASRGRIVRMVVRQHAVPVGVGLALGAAATLALSAAARGLLFGLEPHDPASFTIAAGLLGLIAAWASLVPARRAAGINPTVALKHE